jgi:hypothetical protein
VTERRFKMEKKDIKKKTLSTFSLIFLVLVIGLMAFNQIQINKVSGMLTKSMSNSYSNEKRLDQLDLNSLKSTGHTIAAVFPVERITSAEDAMEMMFPTGTPDYGEALGVSYDDPVNSLSKLASMYRGLKNEVETNNPEAWNRFLSLASKPVGISCEFCCGLRSVGIDKQGNSACGCQHNPALLSIALYLTAYTDYSDGEILREVMRWKTLFFPKDMIKLGMTVAGGDTTSLNNLPGMVGGC